MEDAEGDSARKLFLEFEQPRTHSSTFEFMNAGKASVQIDLKAHREQLMALLAGRRARGQRARRVAQAHAALGGRGARGVPASRSTRTCPPSARRGPRPTGPATTSAPSGPRRASRVHPGRQLVRALPGRVRRLHHRHAPLWRRPRGARRARAHRRRRLREDVAPPLRRVGVRAVVGPVRRGRTVRGAATTAPLHRRPPAPRELRDGRWPRDRPERAHARRAGGGRQGRAAGARHRARRGALDGRSQGRHRSAGRARVRGRAHGGARAAHARADVAPGGGRLLSRALPERAARGAVVRAAGGRRHEASPSARRLRSRAAGARAEGGRPRKGSTPRTT